MAQLVLSRETRQASTWLPLDFCRFGSGCMIHTFLNQPSCYSGLEFSAWDNNHLISSFRQDSNLINIFCVYLSWDSLMFWKTLNDSVGAKRKSETESLCLHEKSWHGGHGGALEQGPCFGTGAHGCTAGRRPQKRSFVVELLHYDTK